MKPKSTAENYEMEPPADESKKERMRERKVVRIEIDTKLNKIWVYI